MPFFVVQDRRGYKFTDGILELGIKREEEVHKNDDDLEQVTLLDLSYDQLF
jgi:hypothetical protein